MVHQYQLNGYNIVLDTCSGSIHVVDEVAYDIIALFEGQTEDEIIAAMLKKYAGHEDVTEQDLRDCISDVAALKQGGKLYTPDIFEDLAYDFKQRSTVVKALCLGAELVGLGRLYCYALAADGAAGVVRMLEILENEMRSALGLLGATAIDQLGPGYVHAAMPTNMPHVHSAFPLLRLDDSGY